jgi:hypothetical protein
VIAVGAPAVVNVYVADFIPAANPVVALPPIDTRIWYVPATSALIESFIVEEPVVGVVEMLANAI